MKLKRRSLLKRLIVLLPFMTAATACGEATKPGPNVEGDDPNHLKDYWRRNDDANALAATKWFRNIPRLVRTPGYEAGDRIGFRRMSHLVLKQPVPEDPAKVEYVYAAGSRIPESGMDSVRLERAEAHSAGERRALQDAIKGHGNSALR
jgi:hypothetical protein